MNEELNDAALKIDLDEKSVLLRKMIIDCIKPTRRGHIGPAMSLVEIIRVLYDSFLNVSPRNPLKEDRDIFILSKGHGCLALYAVLAEKNFFPKTELLKTCQFDSILGGHPENGKVPGVEASTGSLGHGLPIGVGMAMGAKIKNKKNKIVVLLGDGEINEGSIWESAMSASKHRLSNLIIMIDYNKIQSNDFVFKVSALEPIVDKWRSFGFKVEEVNGHSIDELNEVLKKVNLNSDTPTAIICHTIKGKGLSFAENNPFWHHKNNLSDEDIEKLERSIGISK